MDAQTKMPVHTRTEVRNALNDISGITTRDASGANYYQLDRLDAAKYLWGMPEWKSAISEFFQGLLRLGEKVVYVDICGRSNAASLGADKNYSFSLQPTDHHGFRCGGEVRVQGDIFSAKDFYSFVNLLRRNGDHPALVTFEPVAGLQSHAPRLLDNPPTLQLEVTYQRLENNLRKMIQIVRPGGFIFLECPFQGMNFRDWFEKKPVEQYESSLWVKDFCTANKCDLQIVKTIVGPRYLLRKRMPRKSSSRP